MLSFLGLIFPGSLLFADATTTAPQELDAIEFITHGGFEIRNGDVVKRSDFSLGTSIWSFQFSWPNAVPNSRALFVVFRGTFGNLEGGEPIEQVNFSSNLAQWHFANPKTEGVPIALPRLASEQATSSTYTVMIAERDPEFSNSKLGYHTDDQVKWFASGGTEGIPPLKYALLTFEYDDETAIDPLILQYEPILYLHENENYRPMNVEAFVGASALWDDRGVLPDLLRKFRGTVTIDELGAEDTEDWYLAFSADEAKSFDPDKAKERYDQLVSEGEAQTTYYAYKTTDSYTDSEGVAHEFIVLQYWYFYAFNDWAEHGGFNNHEGDWESVFVFLDADTEEPMYVAYSSHLNDGIAEPDNPFQYDSVRREWNSNDVQKEGSNTKSFVALGSHANYPTNGNNGEHVVPGFSESKLDKTSTTTERQLRNDDFSRKILQSTEHPSWLKYEGKWGADGVTFGSDGPQGPNFLSPLFSGNVIRFKNPVEWAGIDKIASKTIKDPTSTLTFPEQGVLMDFAFPLQVGAEVSVSPHEESISFGNNLDTVELLPHFWEFDSNLTNYTFQTTVALSYDEEVVLTQGLHEQDLSVFYYNEDLDRWTRVPSTINTLTNTISFITSHFSRYSIGVEETSYPFLPPVASPWF